MVKVFKFALRIFAVSGVEALLINLTFRIIEKYYVTVHENTFYGNGYN